MMIQNTPAIEEISQLKTRLSTKNHYRLFME